SLTLFGAKFRSRFLYGSDTNIIVNRTATNDVNLIENGSTTTATTNVTLYHKATGAQKYRVRVANGTWSGWSNYAATSSCTVNTVTSSTPYVEYSLNNSMGGINILEGTRNMSSTISSGTIYVYGLMAVGGAGGGSFSSSSSYGGIGLYNNTTEKFLIGERYE